MQKTSIALTANGKLRDFSCSVHSSEVEKLLPYQTAAELSPRPGILPSINQKCG
jgi:hypothetical protein